jgi:phosphoglycolate phosphatase
MATLLLPCGESEPRRFEANLVVFDKDATLIDFHALWVPKIVAGVEALTAATCTQWGCTPNGLRGRYLQSALYRTLGYDEGAQSFAPEGPTVSAANETLGVLAATVVYQQGQRGGGALGWSVCAELARTVFLGAVDACFSAELIRPLAGAVEAVRALHAAGVAVAVVTADDEAPTRRSLEFMGLAEAVGFVAGGDSGYGHKPSADALVAACAHANVPAARTAVMGDTVTDLLMAQRGGAGLRVGVATGFAGPAALAPHADCVLSSLDELRVAPLV